MRALLCYISQHQPWDDPRGAGLGWTSQEALAFTDGIPC
jgi:hypothetical protein